MKTGSKAAFLGAVLSVVGAAQASGLGSSMAFEHEGGSGGEGGGVLILIVLGVYGFILSFLPPRDRPTVLAVWLGPVLLAMITSHHTAVWLWGLFGFWLAIPITSWLRRGRD